MAGVWKIEDVHECAPMSDSVRSRNWRKNKAMAAEAITLLDLVKAVEHNVRGYDEGKIITHIDCRKVWEFLTCEQVKSSQFAGDRGSIISKIIVLENKTKIEIEHAHAKTKAVNEDAITNKGITMVLECDAKAKEKRIKCVR